MFVRFGVVFWGYVGEYDSPSKQCRFCGKIKLLSAKYIIQFVWKWNKVERLTGRLTAIRDVDNIM